MNRELLLKVVTKWRRDADTFRHRGLTDFARFAESFITDLELEVRQWDLEALTLDEAATESGYSYSALQKKVASGELHNAGRKGSPRIRRSDVPRKVRSSERRDIADTILEKRTA